MDNSSFEIGQTVEWRGGFGDRVSGRVTGHCPNGNIKVTALHFIGADGERSEISASPTARNLIITTKSVRAAS